MLDRHTKAVWAFGGTRTLNVGWGSQMIHSTRARRRQITRSQKLTRKEFMGVQDYGPIELNGQSGTNVLSADVLDAQIVSVSAKRRIPPISNE